jgi:hypothetical protein
MGLKYQVFVTSSNGSMKSERAVSSQGHANNDATPESRVPRHEIASPEHQNKELMNTKTDNSLASI